jgi:hypothetical protein
MGDGMKIIDKKFNRRPMTIDLAGNWHDYMPVVPDGFTALGVVHRGVQSGALVRNTFGDYLMIYGTTRIILRPPHKVAGALAASGFLEK